MLILGSAAVIVALAAAGLWYTKKHAVAGNPQVKSQPAQEENLTYEAKYQTEEVKPLPVPPPHRSLKLPILMYHHIGEPPPNPGKIREDLTVSPENFQQQVQWLKDHGYQSIKFSELYQYSLGQISLPKKPVIISFDDGYQDVFDNAIPVLRQAGMTGSFAIITQYPATHSGTNFYANWDEIKAAQDLGMEIVSHTQDHFDGKNPKYSAAFIANNLAGSVSDIKDHLGFTTHTLIYPYGRYTPQYLELAKKAGFTLGITVHAGNTVDLDNLMEIPRVRVHHTTTLKQFAEAVER